jgi:hypothetical protein
MGLLDHLVQTSQMLENAWFPFRKRRNGGRTRDGIGDFSIDRINQR